MRIAPKQTLTRIIPIILIPDLSQTNAPKVEKFVFIFILIKIGSHQLIFLRTFVILIRILFHRHRLNIGLSGKVFLRDTAGSPERARSARVA